MVLKKIIFNPMNLKTSVILSLLGTLSFNSGTAQDIQPIKKERMKNFIAAPFASFEFFNVKNNSFTENGYDVDYNPMLSYSTGLELILMKNEKLQFTGSLAYSKKNIERVEVCKECQTDYFYKSEINFSYIEGHVGATYLFMNSRFDIGAYTDFNVSYLLKSTETRTTEKGNVFEFNNKEYSNGMILGFEPGLYFNYNLTYRLSLGLKTGYRVYFNGLLTENNFKNNAISAQPGLYYKF